MESEIFTVDLFDYSTSFERVRAKVDSGARETGDDVYRILVPNEIEVDGRLVGPWGGGLEAVRLFGNVTILSYRLDLLLVDESGQVAISIECDGHDFHNVTKQQAASDRSRDRELNAIGITTLRFTGSEIHHDIQRCASDVFAVLRHQCSRRDEHYIWWSRGYRSGFERGRASSNGKEPY